MMGKRVKNVRIPRKQRIKESMMRIPDVNVLVYSFIVTITVYALMLFIERTVLSSDDYTTVYVAQTDIGRNTVITADNSGVLFAAKERKSDWLPDNCITDISQLVGMMTVQDIVKNEVMTGRAVSAQDRRAVGIESPIEVAMNANNLSQVVGGILREGDRINIWSVVETNNNGTSNVVAEKICDYAYVTRVFTAAGIQVNGDSGNDSAAMVINIIIPEEKEPEFNIALEKGTLRIGRCMYEREKNKYAEE